MKMLEEHRDKIRLALIGRHVSPRTEFKKGVKHKNTDYLTKRVGSNNPFFGRKHTPEARKKMREMKIGKRSNSWRGGITKVNKLIRTCEKYKKWRMEVFIRDNWTCQDCGKRGSNLNAHHINKMSDILKLTRVNDLKEANNCEELWKAKNGITLCYPYHRIIHYKTHKEER